MLDHNENNINVIGENCIGCASCFQSCGKGAILMEEDAEGFQYPRINKSKCIACGVCLKKCPIAIKIKKNIKIRKKVYAAYNLDSKERYVSSSGGLFILLAKAILLRGGIIYGAAYNKSLEVLHTRVDSVKSLYMLLKSKYIQSQNVDSYIQCKQDLLNGKEVLYTGTPCQIAALKAYLGVEYDNLITQDIICHGVPSSLVWREYLQELQTETDDPVTEIDFRSKVNGWKVCHLSYKWQKGRNVNVSRQKDPYFLGFNASLYLRKSCYACKFKESNNYSDISLGDFWAVNSLAPVMDDDKGVSIVLLNTDKGELLFNDIKEQLRYMPIDYELACKKHSMIRKSADSIKERELFFKIYNGTNLKEIVNKFCPKVSLKIRIKKKALQVVKKVIK